MDMDAELLSQEIHCACLQGGQESGSVQEHNQLCSTSVFGYLDNLPQRSHFHGEDRKSAMIDRRAERATSPNVGNANFSPISFDLSVCVT